MESKYLCILNTSVEKKSLGGNFKKGHLDLLHSRNDFDERAS